MSTWRPRYLKKPEIEQTIDEYLKQLEVNAVREHLRLTVAEHLNGSELTHGNLAELMQALEDEKERLLKKAPQPEGGE